MTKRETTASLIRKHGYTTYRTAKHGVLQIERPEGGFYKSGDRVPNPLFNKAIIANARRFRAWRGRR